MASIFHTELVHKHTGSTSSAPASAHTLQPCQNASTGNLLLHSCTAEQPISKNPHFFLVRSQTRAQIHTKIQPGGPSMWMGWAWWKEGIMCLTGSLSDLSEAAEKQPGGCHPLTQMTNVHWAFSIPLLSVKTNASYCACVSVKWFSATVASNKWHASGHIYLLCSEKIEACACFSVKNGRPLA